MKSKKGKNRRDKRLQRYFKKGYIPQPTKAKPVVDPSLQKRNDVRERYTSKKVASFKRTDKKIKNIGAGKHKGITFSVLKSKLNVSKGDVILQPDGFYQVERIIEGCALRKDVTIYCKSFDPKKIGKNKVMVPKKI